MKRKTDEVKQSTPTERALDATDRRLLGVLVDDATVSYAELGERAALSAPAAHERVKRMRRSGVIRKTAALIDPDSVKKPLLSFVHIDTKGWGMTPDLMAISSHHEVEEIHSVAGDTSMLLKIRTENTRTLETLLSDLFKISGVEATRTYIVLSTYLERPVQPG
ncbi:Lrp/AsnC family transcriptional regulator [Vibrio sp. S4M6]|uniref:Lrp/AsnC family transcriptional regulator n=1 Tax=Vibrio sinus TaxID=2946865 RepID=UPI00202A0E37|nr:Lrp/AsnC family transcriptional regulator [Vibrio sinus]MCL9782042.1 Lrp/AsnC family transcriptional regulator [Vibrio sinus]